MGAGGINLPQDVADLTDGLLSLGGLGLAGWLPRTTVPNSKLNAAVVGFQRLNNLKPDGLVNPDGPTIKVLNGYLPAPTAPETIPQAPVYEAAVFNQSPETPAGQDITARGMGDEALARSRADEARYEAALEAERRADDPFGDLLGGNQRRYQRNHIDDMLDEQTAEARAQLDRGALAGLDPNSMVTKLSDDYSRGQAVFGPMGVPGNAFRTAIGRAEWYNRSPEELETLKRTENFYQFLEGALIDVGLMKRNREWTGQWGINSMDQFKMSWSAQERAFSAYMPILERYLHVEGDFDAFDYVGQEIQGVVASFRITPVGLIAAAHRRGHGGVLEYLEYQKAHGWKSNDFEDLSEEEAQPLREVEKRLRTFENLRYN